MLDYTGGSRWKPSGAGRPQVRAKAGRGHWRGHGEVLDTQLSELRRVGGLLDTAGLDWWIDSGTLLGLHRERRILPWDSDVDLGCWHEPKALERLESTLDQSPWRWERRQWRNVPYIYNIYTEPLVSNIQVFHRNDDHAVCPSKTPGPPADLPGSLAYYLRGLVRRPLRLLWLNTGLLDRWVRRGTGRWGVALSWWRIPA
jgi:hypothetical protein